MTNDNHEIRLWQSGRGFVDSVWKRADSTDIEEVTRTGGNLILPLTGWLEIIGSDPALASRYAVELAPADAMEAIRPYLNHLPLIVLSFPGFADGRSYSKAELLRSRYGYKGTLRACGEVLPDQLAHMLRCGFDELEVAHPIAIEWLASGKTDSFPAHYQPASVSASKPDGRYSWRRIPA